MLWSAIRKFAEPSPSRQVRSPGAGKTTLGYFHIAGESPAQVRRSDRFFHQWVNGMKYDIVPRDLFNRFREPPTSGAILALKHLLSPAHRRVAVAVSNSVLFSTGAEQALREEVITKGMIEAERSIELRVVYLRGVMSVLKGRSGGMVTGSSPL
jgi:hypothetical protein